MAREMVNLFKAFFSESAGQYFDITLACFHLCLRQFSKVVPIVIRKTNENVAQQSAPQAVLIKKLCSTEYAWAFACLTCARMRCGVSCVVNGEIQGRSPDHSFPLRATPSCLRAGSR